MKFTSEKLLKFFGLKVGDKIKVDGFYYPFVIFEESGKVFAKPENCLSSRDFCSVGALTNILLNNEYEVVKPKKKLGDMKCSEMICSKCPLRITKCDVLDKTLYQALESYKKYLNSFNDPLKLFEKTFIASMKAELDKEAEECEK